MHSERDWLVKRVFPALRERLEPFRIHLVDIDLRWGVTKEQAENDEILDICLSQIDECRPFFLGIIGERYGWVSDRVNERVTSKWNWVRDHIGKSITELEILYGVLNNPTMHSHAFFCFRDPKFLSGVPEYLCGDFEVESVEHKRKLNSLKQAIRDSGLPMFENYPCRYAGLRDQGRAKLEGLDEFGQRILEWLWNSIGRELQLPEVASDLDAEVDPLAEEQAYHERFMESRLRVYIGRNRLQESLIDFATGNDEFPCLVTGPSGSGKSAALAYFTNAFAASHPDAFVIPHFVGASPASTSVRTMLLRFCSLLKLQFDLSEDVPQDTNGLITAFIQIVYKITPDHRVVIIVDALNQLDEAENAQRLPWMPWTFPGHVKLICSCIDDAGRREPALESFAIRPHKRIAVEPLTVWEREAILKQVPSLSAKTLDARQAQALLGNPATSNPLFLLVALEELRGFGSFEQLNQRIDEFPREGDAVTVLFRQVIGRLERDFDTNVVRALLTLIASARRGLSDRELLDLLEGLGVAIHQSTGDLFPVLRQLRAYLQHRGRLWDFFHRNLFKAVRDHYLPTDELRCEAHDRLATYFAAQDYFTESLDEQRTRATRLPPTPRSVNSRKVDELPYQLLQVAKLSGKDDPSSPQWNAVADLFTDLQFLESKTGSPA